MSDLSNCLYKQEIKRTVEAALKEPPTAIRFKDLGEEVIKEFNLFLFQNEMKKIVAVTSTLVSVLNLEETVT
uniref:Dynein light chain n=1 Tax=Strongyloides venezuelensis TaxID=75913 RepID=A0A0K0FMQ5_STRVS